jgi:hypothetical protein
MLCVWVGVERTIGHRCCLYLQGPPPPPGQLKFTVADTCDRIKEEFNFLQAQYHRQVCLYFDIFPPFSELSFLGYPWLPRSLFRLFYMGIDSASRAVSFDWLSILRLKDEMI